MIAKSLMKIDSVCVPDDITSLIQASFPEINVKEFSENQGPEACIEPILGGHENKNGNSMIPPES